MILMQIIPFQVPGIETCSMSIDEIARIFSKSQSLYRGGEVEIFLKSQGLYRGGVFGIFLKSQGLGRS